MCPVKHVNASEDQTLYKEGSFNLLISMLKHDNQNIDYVCMKGPWITNSDVFIYVKLRPNVTCTKKLVFIIWFLYKRVFTFEKMIPYMHIWTYKKAKKFISWVTQWAKRSVHKLMDWRLDIKTWLIMYNLNNMPFTNINISNNIFSLHKLAWRTKFISQ